MDRTHGRHDRAASDGGLPDDAGHVPAVHGGVAIDQVCGMGIGSSAGGPRVELEGETFAFCSVGCREKFIADPARYLTSAAARTGADAADAADTGGEPGGGAGGYSGMEFTCGPASQLAQAVGSWFLSAVMRRVW